MGQDLNKIERVYDSVAKEYSDAFCNEHDRKPMDRESLLRFSREIGGRGPVWDLGCGPGQTARYLKDLGLEISGLDLSGRILEQARKNNPDIHFRKGNILSLEFETGSIAGIAAFYSIVHFSEDQVMEAFREIFRVLQPDGIFLLTCHIGDRKIHVEEFLGRKVDTDFMFFTAGFIRGSLKKAGFEKIETIERDPYPDVEYQSRRAYVFAVKPDRRLLREGLCK